LCERTLFVSFGIRASSDPALGRTLLKLCLSRLLANPFISELLRFQGPWPKIGFWPFKYSEFLWLSWSLTIIGLLAKHKIFRVSLNLVLDHNLTFGHTKFFLEFLPTQVIDQKSPLTTNRPLASRAFVKFHCFWQRNHWLLPH